jgi:YidC/Oxa1 family membrane protein insertase
MKDDKNFFIVIVITICVLIFYPMLAKKMAPQYFPEPKQTLPQTQQQKTPAVPKSSMQPVDRQRPSLSANYSQEKSYVLHSDVYDIEINSPGADIKSIKLVQIPDPDTGKPTILMDTENLAPGIFADTGLTNNAKIVDVQTGENGVDFTYKSKQDLKIRKKLRIDPGVYRVSLDYEIENPTNSQQVIDLRIITATGIKKTARAASRFDNQITVLKNNKTIKKNIASSSEKTIEGQVHLTGAMLRYFSMVGIPLVSSDFAYTYNPGLGESFAPTAVGLGTRALTIPPKDTVRLNYVLYAGPNDHEQMSKLNLQVEKIRGSGLFAGLSDLMLLLLRLLHKLFKNYGLAVIGLALTINIFLYPLTFKSLKSMKDMQALQPMIEKLRNEYKDNPQKLNKEMMELYKKHKVNPAGGCLPMLLQMPIFISLYGVLMRAIELRGAQFLWIKNLAAPDAFMVFPSKLPLLGSNLNILPLAMMAFTFLQQKATNTGHANEQQKAMALMMPLVLGIVFYNFPSGLVLYFLTNSLFSFFVQKSLAAKA